MRRAKAAVAVILFAVLAGAGCGSPAPTTTTSTKSTAALPQNFGDVLTAEVVADIDPLLAPIASAQRFAYVSRSGINDGTTHVGGMLFVPNGQLPDGGWPVVAFGHTVTGTLPGCGPSLAPTQVNSAATVQQLLQAGYAVVMSDYQGLANVDEARDANFPSYHPFLDSTTAGYNLIDSVRAARTLTKASDHWFAFGIGQGGQAAWAANELDENHGQGLTLLGTVAVSPAADINGLADGAETGTLNPEQRLDLQAFLAALKSTYGTDFKLDDFRSGAAQQQWDALLQCQGQTPEQRVALGDRIGPDDLRPHNPIAAAELRGYLQKASLPQGPTSAPMLVIYGANDPLIPPAWTEQALDRACKMGDVIQIRRLPDDATDPLDMTEALDWMSQRANAVPAPNDCPGGTP
ncbi:lipase family protein [Mycobacterium sp. 2YAF39]|uniref:lipase family protein n=1 Tax=Mycobacterium sp. 2YAF39 TaxID=3233033 RepID=UPI003F9BF5F2